MKFASLVVTAAAVRSARVAINQDQLDDYFGNATRSDPIYDEFMQRLDNAQAALDGALTRTSRTSALAELNMLKRFKALKNAVMWMSMDPRFGKYCYYGCYCLAALHESEGELAPKQKGAPRDGVDAACKVQQDCYHCMAMDPDVKDTCTTNARYHFELTEDANDPGNVAKRDMTCTDLFVSEGGTKKTHCKRAVCECDRGLAMRLSAAEAEWTESNHKVWGSFDDDVCVNALGGGGDGDPRLECCGRYTDDGLRFPFSSVRSSCCGSKTYNPDLFECCSEDNIKPIGAC